MATTLKIRDGQENPPRAAAWFTYYSHVSVAIDLFLISAMRLVRYFRPAVSMG